MKAEGLVSQLRKISCLHNYKISVLQRQLALERTEAETACLIFFLVEPVIFLAVPVQVYRTRSYPRTSSSQNTKSTRVGCDVTSPQQLETYGT